MPSVEEVQQKIKSLGLKGQFFIRKEIRELSHILGEHEELLAAVSGNYNDHPGLVVATDRRVIFVDKQFFGLKVEDFAYRVISSVQFHLGFAFGEITIYASGNKARITQIPRAETQPFAEFVRKKVEEMSKATPAAQQTGTAQAEVDPIAQLERLAALKTQGVLSEEEFATHKAKILSDMLR